MFNPKYETITDGCFTFDAKVIAIANNCLNNESIKNFWYGFCCRAGEIEIKSTDELVFSIGEAEKLELDGNQYAVNVEKTGICITGESEKGLINGFMTLLHQIKVKQITDEKSVFEIKCGVFKEKPLLKNQIIHFCVFPETELWEIDKFFRLCAALKYSHIVLEFWGMLKYDCMKELAWKHAFTKEQIRPIIKTANELGVEIIPMFNHWGHAAASRVMHGKHVVLDQNPRLQPLFSDDGWNWNIDMPEVQNLLRQIRGELIELCGNGKYFHLGCDEAYNFEITTENYTLLTDYINDISAELSEQGRRPIMWGDMLISKHENYNQNNAYTTLCNSEELEKKLLTGLDRNIVIADWQYNVKEAPVETALVFKNAGFDTLLCPWDTARNLRAIMPCMETAINNGLFGVMHTTWNTLSKGMRDVSTVAYHSWTELDKSQSQSYFVTYTAKILRNVYFVDGDYEKAGWSKNQIASLMD